MVVQVGVMELPVTEDPDDIQTYMNGEDPSGGLWTALTRSSNHDHSGGLNGVQLGATSIPDGSITSAKLDPSVLGPYALVDGSKPFTGQVSMNADAIVRDTLFFGAKPAGVGDASLKRTGAGALRADAHLGVGVSPAAWGADFRAAQVGSALSVFGPTAAGGGWGALIIDTYNSGTADIATTVNGAINVAMDAGFRISTAPPTTVGAVRTFTQRLNLAPTGTLTLTPDAGQAALQWSQGLFSAGTAAGTNARFYSSGNIELQAVGGYVHPNTADNIYLGAPTFKWNTVFAATGTINTSSAAVKEGITPLDPAACYQAAKDVRWYSFSYLPPAYQEPPEQEGEDAETREARLDESRAAHAKMLVETAPARNQRGFVFPAGASGKDEAGGTLPPVPELFGLSDRESTTPQADLATLGAALQEVIRRLEAVEAQP